VRANHAFQTSEFAIHRAKIEIWRPAEQSYFHPNVSRRNPNAPPNPPHHL
jgi:hypothetical protein